MPIPPYSGPRTYFVLADVEPKEVMNFGAEDEIRVDGGAALEVLGHMLAFWKPSGVELDFDALRAKAGDLFTVALSIDALLRLEERGTPANDRTAGDLRIALDRRPIIHSWLEVREVEARANVVGTVHTRYRLGQIVIDGPDAERFRIAARGAWAAIHHPQARLALKDFAAALAQRGDDAFLHAYRSLESVRRAYTRDLVDAEGATRPVWSPMHEALGTDEGTLAPLTDAAKAIRHGDSDHQALLAVREEPAREVTLGLADDVLLRFARDRGFLPKPI